MAQADFVNTIVRHPFDAKVASTETIARRGCSINTATHWRKSPNQERNDALRRIESDVAVLSRSAERFHARAEVQLRRRRGPRHAGASPHEEARSNTPVRRRASDRGTRERWPAGAARDTVRAPRSQERRSSGAGWAERGPKPPRGPTPASATDTMNTKACRRLQRARPSSRRNGWPDRACGE